MANAPTKAQWQQKIVDLYSANIQVIPDDEWSPSLGGGSTEGFISREFKFISGTKTDARGRTIYVGTKG